MSLTPGRRFRAFSILSAQAPQSIPSMRSFSEVSVMTHLDVPDPAATISGHPANQKQAEQADQGELAKPEPPGERGVVSPIKRKAHAERTEKTAGIAAHAMKSHRRPAPSRVCGLHGPGGERGTVEEGQGEPDRDQDCGQRNRGADAPARAKRGDRRRGHRDRNNANPPKTLRHFVAEDRN